MKQLIYFLSILFVIVSCSEEKQLQDTDFEALNYSKNILNYHISPKHKFDKDGLMFSDQGAWFAYSFSDSLDINGFSGPFLMTQQNGIWAGPSLANFNLTNDDGRDLLIFNDRKAESYASHLRETQSNKDIELHKELAFLSPHTALMRFTIKNISKNNLAIKSSFSAQLFDVFDKVSVVDDHIELLSDKSKAKGYIRFINENISAVADSSSYKTAIVTTNLAPNSIKTFTIAQTFIFPEYSWLSEQKLMDQVNLDTLLMTRKKEKNNQIAALIKNLKLQFQDSVYNKVLAKSHLTLQNNWRVPAGEIEHEGLFPSYHYKWFNGFWSWDSWKHAAGLSYYNLPLAKEQIKLMFKFQDEDGFVADCVYRDTLIERHNYRDTKPPLSAWAVVKIYEKDKDLEFVKYMYPKLKKYHEWWYAKRDHDQDGLCEYGSTDGSLIAAKWESGMDNAIRFDNSKILKNSDNAYSLDQESVDLNAYLYAEKLYLAQLADALSSADSKTFKDQAETLKQRIQSQFYDEGDGWFYDTNLEGDQFIKGAGSEGWTPLWSKVATNEQAKSVKSHMTNPQKFYTKVPFQTMSADHPKFDPLKGYWRGPNWLDQAYFGVKGLRNYGYTEEADKATVDILEGANGILGKGKAIRENYHPLTGEGLHAQNFSWSAAHLIMLLQKN